MATKKALATGSLLLGIALIVGACASGSQHTRSITVAEVRNGRGVEVDVSKALARDLLESAIGSELCCQGEVDEEFGSLLRALETGGPGSRATLREDDGILVARRTRRTLNLSLRGRDGGARIDAVLPWALAECMLGRPTRVRTEVADVRVTIHGQEGGSFELRVD